ncbi:MAG: hypothetical protein GVY28_04340 [Alphaproteobacteria bacterium]|jgi:hypothetical protein|nr:hypothetical protein [Alphaproteobacteria bacterium]
MRLTAIPPTATAAQDPTADLPDILSWRPPAGCLAGLRHGYGRYLDDRWAALRAVAADIDAPIFEAMDLLAPAARARLLRAPFFADGLVRRGDPHLAGQAVAHWLMAELAAQGISVGPAAGSWLCRGDGRIGAGGGVEAAGAPICGITIDDASPAQFPHRAIGRNDLFTLDPADRARARTAVDQALRRLGAARPEVLAAVTGFTEVVALRGEREHAAEFRSGTFDRYVGLVLLTNPHLPTVGAEAMVNALVHEAIHNLLFTVEVLYGRFVVPEDSSDLHVTSPWSGVRLGLASYVHAVLVWYGLYWLWRQMPEAAFDPVVTAGLLDRCRSGFDHAPVSDGLAAYRSILSPPVLAVLDDIEARMADR